MRSATLLRRTGLVPRVAALALVTLLGASVPMGFGSSTSTPSGVVVTLLGHPLASGPGGGIPNGSPANFVLGQPGYLTMYAGNGSSNFSGPRAAAVDHAGDLWVADSQNNRILEFVPPFSDGMAASLVLGQAGFGTNASGQGPNLLHAPTALAFGPNGELWVADNGSNRVLGFAPPFSTDMSANAVLGQTGFGGDGAGSGARNLSGPSGVAVDVAGDVFVADSVNNRVLEFPVPIVSGEPAALALGQPNLTANGANTTQAGLNRPVAVGFDPSGALWVADWGNDRAVEFGSPFSNGESESVELGEYDFNTTVETLPDGMFSPNGVAVDAAGDVFVSDASLPERITAYTPPYSNNEAPALVLGQPTATSSGASTTRAGVRAPAGLALEPTGELWVADSGNDRLLQFGAASFGVTFSEGGLTGSSSWSVTIGGESRSLSANATTFDLPNGSYAYSIGGPSGYLASPASGTVAVQGFPVGVGVQFVHTILGVRSGEFWTAVAIVLAVVVVVESVLILRHRRGPHRPPRGPPVPVPPAAASGEPAPAPPSDAGGSPSPPSS